MSSDDRGEPAPGARDLPPALTLERARPDEVGVVRAVEDAGELGTWPRVAMERRVAPDR
ncbi:MAG: hypothetical protein ACFCGT_22865 [Sandaracinaceae bacterium]